MPCPQTEIHIKASEKDIQATLKGSIGAETAGRMRSLAERVRSLRPARVVVDISEVDDLASEALDGLFEVEQAARDVRGLFELQARGSQAEKLLSKVRLARATRGEH